MQSIDAEQAAHERQGCRGEYEPPEQWHGAGAQSVNGAFRLMAEQVSQKEMERWENDQWFQKSEKGCLERMSCDAR